MPVSVLYIHHAGAFGGSSKSLLEMLKALPKDAVVPYVLLPHGTAADRFEQAGFVVIKTRGIPGVFHPHFGYYRGLRWLLLLRELWYAPFALHAMCRARRAWSDIQLVHLNDASILAIFLARLVFRAPFVVHVRHTLQVQRGRIRRWLLRVALLRCADRVIAIDESVFRTLPCADNACVIHNGEPFSTADLSRESRVGQPRDPSHQCARVGLVGFYPIAKGVYDFIEAARICRDRQIAACFVIVGDNPHNLGGLFRRILEISGVVQGLPVRADIVDMIRDYGLSDRMEVKGFVSDMRSFYQSIDLLCFPSHFEGPGRPVFESAFARIPSIVAMSDPTDDVVIDGQTGLCVPPHDAHALAGAIERLVADPQERVRMGDAAFRLALAEFTAARCASRTLRLYEQVLMEKISS